MSRETRRLDCKPIYHGLHSDPVYTCESLAFLELTALKHPYYLINLQIVHDKDHSQNIGKLTSLEFVDRSGCSYLASYIKYVGLLWFSSFVLLLFELCQRGFQLSNPFHSIWSSKAGKNAAMTFLILAALSGIVYIICLTTLFTRVFWNIRSKHSELHAMSRGTLFRFGSLLIATVICAILTVVWFCLSQFYETHWVWEYENKPPKIHYSGAFITGVYGMWNLYVFAVLLLFSPSSTNMVEDLVELNPTGNVTELCDATNPYTSYQIIRKTAIE
ncbi:unnamed protein product [Didymodactylos carnosus]|uniref:Uncharacterized protein n=1 Tax=Didymodactylos carnosus TaxID=1234261 RepID=A0A8S2D202_9BILA|nr:unnamed protein product [Didymodactylos carnosus]CAF3646066.1 unnamed protein product [Didymodactylos carnosus]